jgi:hypothetical protein
MTTLTKPSLERRLLGTVRDQVAAEPVRQWSEQSLRLCLDFLRKLRENASEMHQALEKDLADGVEARSFARDGGPILIDLDERIALVRELVEALSPAQGAAIESLVAELRWLQRENKATRDLLAEALSRASEPPRPVDWERVRAAEEAHARGETKPFQRSPKGGDKE